MGNPLCGRARQGKEQPEGSSGRAPSAEQQGSSTAEKGGPDLTHLARRPAQNLVTPPKPAPRVTARYHCARRCLLWIIRPPTMGPPVPVADPPKPHPVRCNAVRQLVYVGRAKRARGAGQRNSCAAPAPQQLLRAC